MKWKPSTKTSAKGIKYSKVGAKSPRWVKSGMRVINSSELGNFFTTLSSCLAAGCIKGKHIIIGYNEVQKYLERGKIASIAFIKSGPTSLLDNLVDACLLRRVSVVVLPTEAADNLSRYLKVHKVSVIGVSNEGIQMKSSEVSSAYHNPLLASSSSVSSSASTRSSKRSGIARSTAVVAKPSTGSKLVATEGLECDQATSDTISANLDALRDLSLKLMLQS